MPWVFEPFLKSTDGQAFIRSVTQRVIAMKNRVKIWEQATLIEGRMDNSWPPYYELAQYIKQSIYEDVEEEETVCKGALN